ncbi:sensor histidine kinase [Limobrevibacterium gyesilva]|uniref:histidine kinase n=1 Tax=Limobrevibacterium gyesilva TaxID=2991712 RepID=A0AA41YKW2_9PROT|nr:ATP-binding protein [Limobrevibacterium gyesilva]MCW3474097.1 PAS domain-containing protein [Limobrevibacterium gyesilva]
MPREDAIGEATEERQLIRSAWLRAACAASAWLRVAGPWLSQRASLPADREPRPHGLQRHMVALVLWALLPVGVISAAMVADAMTQARQHYRERLQERSEAVALALDREIETIAMALTVMASAPDLNSPPDRPAFETRAKAVAAALGNTLVLHDPQALPPGGSAPDVLQQVIRDRRAAVGGVSWKPAGEGPAAAVYQPVLRGGDVVAVLELSLTPAQVSTVLAAQNRGPGAVALLTDPQGIVLGSAGVAALRAGMSVPPWLGGAGPHDHDAQRQGKWPDGLARICALSQPDRAPGWLVAVCEPQADYDATWQGPLLERAVNALASLGLGIFAAIALARRLARPLALLTGHARAVAAGADRPEPVPPSPVAEFEALRTSLGSAEAVLRRRAMAEHMAMLEARTSQRLLASVLDGAVEGIHVKDLEGRYVLVNRAALVSLGQGDDDARVLGRRARDILPPDAARRVETVDHDVIETGETRAFDLSRARPSGEMRHYAVTKTPWRDADGRIAGVMTVTRDVTEAQAAEARLRTLQAELLRATRLSSMGAMASGLAHEVNQPLAASTNFLNAAVRLLDRAQAGDAGALDTSRVAVADASKQMLRAGAIVRRLRDFVGRGEAELRPEDVAGLIREACDLAEADGSTQGVTLVTRVAPDTGRALVDRTQIQQVLLNLIRNAAEALQAAPPLPGRANRVVVSAGTAGHGGVEITVADTGPGLAPEVAARLFEPFVSTKRTGMGIGLTICRTIVEGHGGRLAVESSPAGCGTLFRITLPPSNQTRGTHDE